MGAFFLGILASLIAAAIWQTISHLFSFIPSKYPDVRGEWIGEYELNGNIVNETITVKQQFGKKIRGFFISPNTVNPDNEGFKYSFTGTFVAPTYLTLTFTPANKQCTDYGSSVLLISNDHQTITGASASLDMATGKPHTISYKMTRK